MSRFDLIFLVRDLRDQELDKIMICHNVMGVYMNDSRGGGGSMSNGGGSIGGAMGGEAGDGYGSSAADWGMFEARKE